MQNFFSLSELFFPKAPGERMGLPSSDSPEWYDARDVKSAHVSAVYGVYVILPLLLLLVSCRKCLELRRCHRVARDADSSGRARRVRDSHLVVSTTNTAASLSPRQHQEQEQGQSTRIFPRHWWSHRSFLVSVCTFLGGLLGVVWCIYMIVRGAAANLTYDLTGLLLGLAHLAPMAVGRLHTQHQLVKLGLTMITKIGSGSNRTALQRTTSVKKLRWILYFALGWVCMMYLVMFAVLLWGWTHNTRRRNISIILAVAVSTLTIAGAFSTFLLVTRILSTLAAHATTMSAAANSGSPSVHVTTTPLAAPPDIQKLLRVSETGQVADMNISLPHRESFRRVDEVVTVQPSICVNIVASISSSSPPPPALHLRYPSLGVPTSVDALPVLSCSPPSAIHGRTLVLVSQHHHRSTSYEHVHLPLPSLPSPGVPFATTQSSRQMAVWQDKLSMLKKSLVPILLTFFIVTLQVFIPFLCSHLVYAYPLSVIATSIATLISCKQLPIVF
jgi:hypothetical protein